MNYLDMVTAKGPDRLLYPNNYIKTVKSIAVLFFLIFSFIQLSAQERPKAQTPPPPPLPTREISGIVKDSTDFGVIGATVILTSDKDTLKVGTNNDGIFIFKSVKSATYTIVVQSIGYQPSPPMRFKQNDAIPRVVMDPIILKEQKNVLNEVVINGTPSITYKTDTVEYKASDYVVRKNSTVDELLKKMEGMEVGTDGSLVHQGEAVVRAKVNGKEYLGGDITSVIKNLPAEIVDKIQIVDDYGDQAARTGIKDGDPEKILNITTRTDKSVGNRLSLNAAGGNNDRYEAGVFATRINKNQTIGVKAQFNNTVNGVGGGGTGGTTKTGSGSFSYRDKIGKKVEINLNYGYNSTDVNSLNSSYTERYTLLRDPITLRDSTVKSTITRGNEGFNNSFNHNLRLEIEADLDSNNFLRVIPTFNYNSSSSVRADTSYQTGLNHQNQTSANTSSNKAPQFGTSVFYQHIFNKPRRNFSLQGDININNQEAAQQQDSRILYLNNVDDITKDSLVNRIIARKNLRHNYRGSLTYVEPLSLNTQLELNTQVNYNGYDNSAITRNIDPSGASQIIDSLSNIYEYSFTQARIALNYRYGLSNTSKVRFSMGLTAVPALLSGTKVSLGTTTRRSSFNMIPIARFEYLWSRQHRISFNYSGNAIEPSFDQIQPVRDATNPQNPIIGNPNLEATFVHTLRANYNNYIANSKLNYSVNLNASVTDNAVIRNSNAIIDPSITDREVYINETRFTNMDGVYNITGRYSVSKQLDDRKYNLELNGTVRYDHRLSLNRGETNINTVKTFEERFGPRITPTEWFEINPNVAYNFTKSINSLEGFQGNETNTLSLNLDGKVYLWETFLFGYSASKNFVSGINANVTNNPFVINMYIEKEFFERRGKVSLQAYDLLSQNNFLNRDYDDNGGYTDTKSNALSRYFMIRLSMNLQKWTGAKGRDGRGDVRRRGDGSFIE